MDTWEVVCKEKGGRYAKEPETKIYKTKKQKTHQKTSTKTNNNN